MPTTTDHHGCVITWNGRRNSMVTMENRIFLDGQRIPLTITIHRHLLGLFVEPDEKEATRIAQAQGRTPLDCLTLQIASVVKQISEAKPRPGRTVISRPLAPPPLGGRVSVTRDAWVMLSKLPSETYSETRMEAISSIINVLFFFGGGLRRVLHPARGRRAGPKVLGDYLPTAYLACRTLVQSSKTDDNLYKIQTLALNELAVRNRQACLFLDEAKTVPESYQDQIYIHLLVYRAFEGAWQRYGVEGLREPQQALNRYYYREKRLRAAYKKMFELFNDAARKELRNEWISLYLSEPGAAARRYGLV
jgi:hypothetical protein